MVERHGRRPQALVAVLLAMGGAAVVADDAQHRRGVLLVAREGAELARHLGRGRVGDAGHDRGDRAADGAALGAVIGNAGRHQQAADVGIAEAERAVLVGELRDLAARELRHQHRDLEHDGPQPAAVLEGLDVERAVRIAELHQVQRGEVAGRVVEEHVLRAGIGRPDRARRRAGVPVVDGRVILDAGIGRGPGGVADLLPELLGLQRLHHPAVLAGGQVPGAVRLDGAQEVVVDPHRVVGVLAGDGEVGLRIPVGVEHRELDRGVALAGELDHAADVVLRHRGLLGGADLALQGGVLGRIEAALAGDRAVADRLHDGGQVLGAGLGAGDERGDLLLLADLPVDVLLDVRMVDVDDHHLGGAAGGAARLDRAGGPVADLQEAHQAGRTAAAGKLLALAAEPREVRAGARAVLEEARLADPQVHDAVLVDEIVLDRLDEAGVRLRMLVGGRRAGQLAGLEVDVVVALARAVDAVGPVQAGVEPLRRVRRHLLRRQHVAQLVEEGAGVGLAVEIAALPAPVGPGAGEPVEDLAGVDLAAEALGLRAGRRAPCRRHRAPQPRGDAVLLDLLQHLRHAGLAEVLLREDVARHLAPGGRHLDVRRAEHHGPVRIADLADGEAELDVRIGRLAVLGEAPFDPHGPALVSPWRGALGPGRHGLVIGE